MQDVSISEQTDDTLVKSVLADETRQDINTDAAIKELISRGFIIRLLTTGLEIIAPGGLKVKSKRLSSKEIDPTSSSVQSASSSSNVDLNLHFSQTSGWFGGLRSAIGLKGIACIGIVLTLVVGLVTYTSISGHQRQLKLNSLVETAKSLSSKVGKSADDGMKALKRVQRISTRSTKAETEEALNAVNLAQDIANKSRNENQELVDFVRQNEADLRETELTDLVDMTAIYGDSYETYRNSLDEFLTSFKLVLEFERDHFSELSRSKEPEESKYRTLYSNYMSALDKQNNAYKAHFAYIDSVGKQNPKVKELLSDVLSPRR